MRLTAYISSKYYVGPLIFMGTWLKDKTFSPYYQLQCDQLKIYIIHNSYKKQNILHSPSFLYIQTFFLQENTIYLWKPVFGGLGTTQAQTSLRIRAVRPASLLFA